MVIQNLSVFNRIKGNIIAQSLLCPSQNNSVFHQHFSWELPFQETVNWAKVSEAAILLFNELKPVTNGLIQKLNLRRGIISSYWLQSSSGGSLPGLVDPLALCISSPQNKYLSIWPFNQLSCLDAAS